MTRSVKVALTAEVSQFKRNVGEAERATERLADALDDVDGKHLDTAAVKAKAFGSAVEGAAGKSKRGMSEIAAEARRLDNQISATQVSMTALAKEFAAFGDARVLTAFKNKQRQLSELQGLRKALGNAGTEAGGEFANRFGTALAPALRSITTSPHIAAAVAGVAVAAAPLIGATISGAIIGGVGTGGIIGGMALAARDSRVETEIKALGDRLMHRLEGAAGSFVAPAINSIKEIEKALDGIDLNRILSDGADLVPLLTQGVARALQNIGVGIQLLMSEAGPAVHAIGDGIARISETIALGMANLADNGESAGEALRVIFGMISVSLTSVFALVNMMTELWEVAKALGADSALKAFLWITNMGGREAAKSVDQLAGATGRVVSETERLEKAQEALAEQQKLVTTAQDGLQASMNLISARQASAAMTADRLRQAMDGLYGASIRQVDANEAYQASWDELSKSVKDNKNTLDIHTAAGRSNRDALQDLLVKSGELYLADIAAGKSTSQATEKHKDRTAAVREEAKRLRLNTKTTEELIGTYGKIPPKKTTDLVVEGVKQVADRLYDLYVMQRALAEGIPVDSMRAKLGRERGPAKRGGGYASGGRFDGRLPGPPSDVDNLVGHGPRGQVFGLAGGEYVVNARQTQKHLPLLESINAGMDGYAAGGYFPPVDTSRVWPFPVTAGNSKVISEEQARKNVVPSFSAGKWPSSPGSQRGDSGVWRKVVALIRSSGIDQGSFGNAYRPGDPKWHGSGRAVDWMGYNMDALATFLAARRPLELIHRTKRRDYAYTRGVNKGSFNNALMEAHRNHIHIAMARGGVINEHVVGVGRSGATYEFGERGPETVVPGYASGGLVNFAPASGSPASAGGGSRLDYLDAVLVAREAVTALNRALKENGKSWSVATAKGRANRSALIDGIRAAQRAAEAKYAETGSVAKANKVYADYVRQLDRTMKAMGVNAKARRALLKAYSEKPKYDAMSGGKPSNSSATVRAVTDQMAAEEAVIAARAAFAWTKPTFSIKSESGRAELSQLFSFLSAAQGAAQSLFEQTGSKSKAAALYNSYVVQLRTILAQAGMRKADIDAVLNRYGRITLDQPNRWGGVYERVSGGLRDAQIASGGPTRYAWAEKSTGGEAFIPRLGNRQRSEAIWRYVGERWLGQPTGRSAGPVVVQATIPITLGSEVITYQVRAEVNTALGQVTNATVYQTA